MGLTRSEREHAAASSDTREEVYGQGDVVVVGRDGRELEVHQQLEEQLYFTSQLGQLFCVRASNGAMLWHQPAQVQACSYQSACISDPASPATKQLDGRRSSSQTKPAVVAASRIPAQKI